MKTILLAAVAALSFGVSAANAAVVNRLPPPAILVINTNKPVPAAQTSQYDCTTEMGQLRLVRPAQFEVTAYDGVFVQPVCEGEESGAAVRNAGNVGGLRPLIAKKADLVEALADEDYVAEEVVGVRFGGGNTLILYVHHLN